MRSTYNPSVNIVRDSDVTLNYIPTPNAKRAVAQILDDYKKGVRSFQIIGSYGTGKSAFLWAFDQSVTDKKPFFNMAGRAKKNTRVIRIVGAYQSLAEAFEQTLQIDAKGEVKSIFAELYQHYRDLGKTGRLIIQIDEFGKFLEYAVKNAPERELYFVQQLAEFVNDANYEILLLTTIHQSFESYGYGLAQAERQEWTKVKGRFKEITFNEPVEQLLYLASEHIQESFDLVSPKKKMAQSLELFQNSKAFSFDDGFARELVGKLFPLDLISANVLTLALQRYGQNERSLFSFLESSDYTSLAKFSTTGYPYYALPQVYDYLNFNFYSFLSSKYNPDFTAWNSIRYGLESVERVFDQQIADHIRIIKSIGLLNAFAASGAKLDKDFWVNYATSVLGIKGAAEKLDQLEAKSIIRYRNYSQRFILFEGTDLDIESALIEAGNQVSEVTDVPTLLRRYFEFPPVLAKAYSYANGTPRYFQFAISDQPLTIIPQGEIDGFINLVFSDKITLQDVKEVSAKNEQATIYGYYTNFKDVKNLLYDIEKTQKVLDDNKEDRVAYRELETILVHQKSLLTHFIVNNLFGKRSEVRWVHKGQVEKHILSKRSFNQKLSAICREVFSGSPVFKNELVNKNKLSSAIYTAKKNFFKALVNQYDQPDMGLEPHRFPPEKMIYVSLLKNNHFTAHDGSLPIWNIVPSPSFHQLWDTCNQFLVDARAEKKQLGGLVKILGQVPFKLKQGLIDFWVPTFLFLRRDDFALFGPRGYIPNLTEEVLDLVGKDPKNYQIKSFDIAGVRLDIFNNYRQFLDQEAKSTLTNKIFIETIKPFLVFYKSLPEYSRNTKRLSREAIAIREAIVSSQDPEKTFFEDFPQALGTSIDQLKNAPEMLSDYSQVLQSAIRELRTSFQGLVDRFEQFIQNEIFYDENAEFEIYQRGLQERYSTLKKHLLLPAQKTLIQRIDSELDDRRAWLSSIAQAVTGRTLETFRDEDELMLYDKLKDMIIGLDSLTTLSKLEVDEDTEDIIGIQIDSFREGKKQRVIRLPKNTSEQIEALKNSLAGVLSVDKSFNIAALTKLLQELTHE